MKVKTVFTCQQCGANFPKWMGKCSECGEWNSLIETTVSQHVTRNSLTGKQVCPQTLSQITNFKKARIKTGIGEFDRVLGGGIVPGSVVLVAGEPGIGKSTLMLRLAEKTGGLYVSGEESLQQIKIRAERLGVTNENLYFLTETEVETIVGQINESAVTNPGLVVIVDSVQTLFTAQFSGAAGSVGQVRECTTYLFKTAKSLGVPIFVVGHVTKEGAIAGPKILEHMVDTVIYIEGERFGSARLLRATKNRFGATDEVGVFEMTDKGLEEVANPSRLFLKERVKKVPGSVVVATVEGTRPVLVEIQALVVPTQLAIPRRIGQGIDYNRLQLIVAVLTKRLGFPLAGFDIFVNITGGLKIDEPAADLGVAIAIISSFKNLPLDPKMVCFGELGLLGEIREVSQTGIREKEARRLGYANIISPQKFSSINQVAKTLFI